MSSKQFFSCCSTNQATFVRKINLSLEAFLCSECWVSECLSLLGFEVVDIQCQYWTEAIRRPNPKWIFEPYPSSHYHGSLECVPPILATFQICPFSASNDWRKSIQYAWTRMLHIRVFEEVFWVQPSQPAFHHGEGCLPSQWKMILVVC